MKATLLKTQTVGVKADQIRTQAEAALKQNPYLFNAGLTCHSHEGTLVLRGQVSCYFHKQVAQTVAAGVECVEQVINQIQVDDSRKR